MSEAVAIKEPDGTVCEHPNHYDSDSWCSVDAKYIVHDRENEDEPEFLCQEHAELLGLADPFEEEPVTAVEYDNSPLTEEEAYQFNGYKWLDGVTLPDGSIKLRYDRGECTSDLPPQPNYLTIFEEIVKRKNARKAKANMTLLKREKYSVWELARRAMVGGGAHILLFGRQPGTGKTSWPLIVAEELGIPVFACNATEESTAAEPRGHFIHMGNEGFRFILGQNTLAMTTPGLFLINEIDHSSPDLMSYWHAALDDPDRAMVPLPDGKGTIIRPAEGYRVVATMNGDLSDLPEPIRDRFQIKLHITEANPAAIEALPPEYRGLVKKGKKDPTKVDPDYSLRTPFALMRAAKTMGELAAVQAIYGNRWEEVLNAIELARAPEVSKKAA